MKETTERVSALETELAAERRARQFLVATSVSLNSLLSLPDLLAAIMQAAAELLEAEASSLMMLDDSNQELTFAVATGKAGETVSELRVPAAQGIAGWVFQHGEPAIVDDVTKDRRFYAEIDQGSGFKTRSILAVPLKNRDKVIGVVEVINKRSGAPFAARDQDLAIALAAQAAIAIENARLYRKLADAVVESRMSYRL